MVKPKHIIQAKPKFTRKTPTKGKKKQRINQPWSPFNQHSQNTKVYPSKPNPKK